MPAFSESLGLVYEQVSGFMSEQLALRNPTLKRVDSETYPLLLLEVDDDVAGFAAVDENIRDSYSSAYNAFERLYARNRSSWSTKNLSFVLCRTDNNPELDGFYRQIEGDMYFCQKFVIDAAKHARSLAAETARLPFMPLLTQPRMGIGSTLPAKFFLAGNKVNQRLADLIVTSQKRSAEGIWQDCLSGQFERGSLETTSQYPSDVSPIAAKNRIRLSSLSISDFRAYKGRHHFDFSHDVVLLHGPNGLGKTSLFDAIDFFCTGRIGRLGLASSDATRFSSVTTHLDGNEDSAGVGGSLQFENETRQFARRVLDRNQVFEKNGDSLDRKEFLTLLTGISPTAKQARIEHLQRMFRATHYFGQGYQELLIDFRDDSTLSEDVVARMLVVEDYVEASKKLEGVCAIGERGIANLTIRGNSLKAEIAELEKQAQEARGEHPIDEQNELPGAQFVERIGKSVRDALDASGIDQIDLMHLETTNSYLDLLHAESAAIKDQIAELQALSARMSVIADQSDDVTQSTQKLELVKSNILELNKQTTLFRHRFEEIEKQMLNHTAKRSRLEQEMKVRRWLDTTLPEIEERRKRKSKLEAALAEAKTNVGSAEKEALEYKKNVARNRDLLTDKKQAVRICHERQKAILGLQGNLEGWRTAVADKQRLDNESVEAINNLNTCIQNRETAAVALRDRELKLAAAESKLSSAKSSAADLSKLLSDARSLVDDDECPVCGTHYESQKELVSRIESRHQSLSGKAKEVAAHYSECQETFRSAETEFRKIADRIRAIEIEQRSRSARLAEIEESIQMFSRQALSVGLSAEIQAVADQIDSAITNQKLVVKETKLSADSLEEQVGQLLADLALVESRKEKLTARTEDLDREIQVVALRVVELQQAGQALGVTDTEDVSNIEIRPLSVLENEVVAAQADLASANRELKEVGDSLEQAERQLVSLKRQQATLMSKVSAARNDRNEVLRRLRSLGILEEEATVDKIHSTEDGLSLRLTKNDELIIELKKIAVLLERSEVSRQVSVLESESARLHDQLESQVNKEMKSCTNWLAYFRKVKSLVDNERRKSVENYVDQLGPLSAIFQERLRPVYGFGGIELKAVNGTIVAQVRHMDKPVRPSDYFSDSQKQILMLSLFLATTTTQSWSSFSPILLDDPVTHFDDLNAYSFAELLRSLVQRRDENSQFIISTCEERIYNLLRQKFSRCPELDVTAYEFYSIGDRGPEYRQVPDRSDHISLAAG